MTLFVSASRGARGNIQERRGNQREERLQKALRYDQRQGQKRDGPIRPNHAAVTSPQNRHVQQPRPSHGHQMSFRHHFSHFRL